MVIIVLRNAGNWDSQTRTCGYFVTMLYCKVASLCQLSHLWIPFLLLVIGTIIVSQRRPHFNPQTLWICYVTWQGGIKAADGIKEANQLVLKWGDYSRFSGRAQCNHKCVNKWKKETRVSESRSFLDWLACNWGKTSDTITSGQCCISFLLLL